MTPIKMLRLPQLKPQYGLARSTTYKLIAAGLWVRPIRLTARAIGFLAAECDALMAARVAGRSDAEIRALVIKLEAARKNADGAAA